MTEEWRPVVGWEGIYDVSSLGQVRRAATHRILKPQLTTTGYPAVHLSDQRNGRLCHHRVHRLVAVAFIGEPPFLKAETNHIDGDKLNSRASNLEWVTRKQNDQHARRTGLTIPAKLDAAKVLALKQRRAAGETVRGLAREYGISRRYAQQIFCGDNWSHVNQ